MTDENIIRLEPVECSIRIGEYVTRFTYRFPPLRVVGRVQTDDGDIYAIEWQPYVEEAKSDSWSVAKLLQTKKRTP